MTSTAPISQPVAAANAMPGDRGGREGSKATEENAFTGLLAKIVAGNQDGARPEGKAEGKRPPMPEGEHHRRTFTWVAANADVMGEVVAADAAGALETPRTPADELVAAEPGAPPVSMPQTAATGVAATAQTSATLPQPVHDEQPPPGHSARQMPLPDVQPESAAQGPVPVPRETVNITVVRQETHFAPVLSALLAGRSQAPAAQTAADGQVQRAIGDEHAGGSIAPGDSSEPSTTPGTKPLILSAVHAAPGSGRGAMTSGGGGQRNGMAGFGPMNALRGEGGMGGADAAMPADAAITSVRAEASAGGSTTSSAVQLIAERIASEATTEVARPSQPGQTAFLAQSSPLKVLHIQLQPADLGTVTVRMSLREKTLQLDLEVSRGETAQLLQRDKEALSSLLRSAGYLVEGMDVRMADPGAAASQSSASGTQSGPQMQWGGQPGSSNTDTRSSGGRAGDGTQGNGFGGERYGTDGQVGEPSRGGGVYV